MTDDIGVGLALVFVHKFLGARKGHLVNIFIHLFGGHAHAFVRNGNGFILFVEFDSNVEIAYFALRISDGCQGSKFARCIYRVANQLPEKDVVITVQELFNNGKDVLCMYPDRSFLHVRKFDEWRPKKVPQPYFSIN